ncbi:gliding motility-associated C-terminal domain-containing protein [Spirosoma aerophilum]
MKTGLVMIGSMFLSICAQATHIIGGDMSMRAVGTTPGLFLLQLNQYWDETKTVPGPNGNRDGSVILLVYRKQNPVLVDQITLQLKETQPLTFDNEACASLRQLSFTQANYYGNYQFDPTKYTDPGGYYIVWERCCRNDNLTNVNSASADGVGMVFYLEFPPMTKNGLSFRNSAPDFRLPNGDYICINKSFTFNAGATDVDGDQLTYSLVTPLNGYTNRNQPNSTSSVPRASYPAISWSPGYGLTNIIPGNPALSINPTTGQLTVRATQAGLYLFTVQCEEFRNGQRIGVVRRDFQLPVVDCSKNTPPPAVVMANGKPVSELTWCASNPLVLTVDRNAVWAYQWQKDGANLRGSTGDTLRVTESGVYTVVKSQANVCANDTLSQAVKVTLATSQPVNLSVSTPSPYCVGDTLTLQADERPGTTYQWRRNGQTIVGDRASIRVYQSGMYLVNTTSSEAGCDGLDSLQITVNPAPVAKIQVSASSVCPDSSIRVTAVSAPGYRYVWQRNGAKLADTVSVAVVRQAGTYQFTVTAPTGCTALSDSVTIGQFDRPVVEFDSLDPVCVASPLLVALKGQPAGGIYAGAGVTGDQFDPVAAGVGQHTLTYTVTSSYGCRATQKRSAVVLAGPTISGPMTYGIIKGSSVELVTRTNEPIRQYQWEPPTDLSETDVASPRASPRETTAYQLTAVSAAGCPASFTTLVEVVEPLFIPSAFSPNADGLNDAWVIPNISAFSQAEVSIYNRWGELVFFSKGYAQPWDGTYKQNVVQTGVYTYQIRAGHGSLVTTYRGQLTVIH